MSSSSLFAACLRFVVPAKSATTLVRSPLTLFSRSLSFNAQSRVVTSSNNPRNHPVGCQKRCCSTHSSARMMPSGLPLVEQLFGHSELNETYNVGTEIHHFTPTKYIEFSCNVCNEPVAKTFSQHSYEKGVVIIRCGGCKNLHLIADHLGFTGYAERNVEEISAARGETITTKWEGGELSNSK